MGPIGVFDSGYGGLTVFRELIGALPEHDFIYLGDNARSPYGSRSFETIYRYTRQAVYRLFEEGAPLVILACNTASARALRAIQQHDLPATAPDRKVLGVLRPTTEEIGHLTSNRHIGVLGTEGTVRSDSYRIEIEKFFPRLVVTQHPCPMWVPIVENGEAETPGADWFIRRDLERVLERDPKIDTLLLACTHYPLLMPAIRKFLPPEIRVIDQGTLVARKTVDYLRRHPEIDRQLSRKGKRTFLTTEAASLFNRRAESFFRFPLTATSIEL